MSPLHIPSCFSCLNVYRPSAHSLMYLYFRSLPNIRAGLKSSSPSSTSSSLSWYWQLVSRWLDQAKSKRPIATHCPATAYYSIHCIEVAESGIEAQILTQATLGHVKFWRKHITFNSDYINPSWVWIWLLNISLPFMINMNVWGVLNQRLQNTHLCWQNRT